MLVNISLKQWYLCFTKIGSSLTKQDMSNKCKQPNSIVFYKAILPYVFISEMTNEMEENKRASSPSMDNMMDVAENPEDCQDGDLQAQFNSLSLDQIMQMTSQTKTLEELQLEYTEQQLDSFREKRDAPIEDKNILDSPELNHLTKTHKPMALMNTLKQKETGSFENEERSVQRQDPVFGSGAQSSLWYTEILINKSRVGEGISQGKKMSAHYAALNMFRNIFPKGTTWNDVKEFIAIQKKPLQELQRQKDTV